MDSNFGGGVWEYTFVNRTITKLDNVDYTHLLVGIATFHAETRSRPNANLSLKSNMDERIAAPCDRRSPVRGVWVVTCV